MANFEHAEDDPKHVKMSGHIPAACDQVQPGDAAPAPGRDAEVLPCAIPSFAAASELLSAPYSCLVMNTHRRHIALPPMYLKKKKTGIQEELEAELLRFSQRYNTQTYYRFSLNFKVRCCAVYAIIHTPTRTRVNVNHF